MRVRRLGIIVEDLYLVAPAQPDAAVTLWAHLELCVKIEIPEFLFRDQIIRRGLIPEDAVLHRPAEWLARNQRLPSGQALAIEQFHRLAGTPGAVVLFR